MYFHYPMVLTYNGDCREALLVGNWTWYTLCIVSLAVKKALIFHFWCLWLKRVTLLDFPNSDDSLYCLFTSQLRWCVFVNKRLVGVCILGTYLVFVECGQNSNLSEKRRRDNTGCCYMLLLISSPITYISPQQPSTHSSSQYHWNRRRIFVLIFRSTIFLKPPPAPAF